MNALTIQKIFSNIDYYQDQYLSILNNADLYFSIVDDAQLQLRFVKDKQLYLGDLLQLWFSEKWIFNPENKISLSQFFTKQIAQSNDHLYVFAIRGNAVTGQNICKAWNIHEQKVVDICLDAILPYYCYFESITRPSFHLGASKILI